MTTLEVTQEVKKYPDTIEVKTHKCTMCGERFSTGRWCNDVAINMRNRSLCYTDNFWYDLWLLRDRSNVLRIDGKHYMVSDGLQKGFGGDKFKVRMYSGLTFETDNLWHQGDIPLNWRKKLPNNAEFVKV